MNAAPAPNKRYFFPDLADLIFALILYLILCVHQNSLFNDGSTGWHLVSGNYILQHYQIPYSDIMSYTFAGKPWVAYEWLSDLLMAMLCKLGGLNLLTIVAASSIAFLFFLLYRRCRDTGCNFAIAAMLIVCGAIVSSIHWLIRPHLFTFFGVYIFTALLDRYYRGSIDSRTLTAFLGVTMLIWANCHPGYLIGLGLIGIYCLCTLIESIFLDEDGPTAEIKTVRAKQSFMLFVILLLSALIALINPNGFALYSYIGHYLFNTSSIIAITDEFLSPVFHGRLQASMLEVSFGIFIIGLVISRVKLNLPELLLYLVFAHMSLSAQRNMALYVIVALPIIARLYSDTIFSSNGGKLFGQLNRFCRSFITKFAAINKNFTGTEKLCSVHLLPICIFAALVCIAINNGKIFGMTILQSGFPEKVAPSQTLTAIKNLHLNPKKGMAMDNWGGIIRYTLDYPVFIDDRADFYGTQFFKEYGVMVQATPGWQRLLDKYQINWVLLPPNVRLIGVLAADNHWQKAAEDKASVLMIRK